MEELIGGIEPYLEYFLLLFFRITALIVSSPVLGRKIIPNTAKIGLCLVISYVVFSASGPPPVLSTGSVLEYGFLCVKEILFGLILGYVTTLFFSIAHTAGSIIDMQIGFSMSNVYDAQSNISAPVTGNMLNIVMLISFFSVNGHLKLIQIIMGTFSIVPVGQVSLSFDITHAALQVFALTFVLAINVSMPMIVAALMAEIAMGILIRMVPQMNMFVVGIPLYQIPFS